MRAAETVEREVNLSAIDVNVGIVGERDANAIVDGEDELAVGNVILQTLRTRQRSRELLPAVIA